MVRKGLSIATVALVATIAAGTARAVTHPKSQNVLVIPNYTGGGWGGGSAGTFNPAAFPNYAFTTKTPPQVTAAADLAGFDTVILYQFCNLNASSYVALQNLLVNWIQSTSGKLLIWDSDSCSNATSYGWLGALDVAFDRFSPGQTGALAGSLSILDDDKLGSSNPSSPYYLDLNAIVTQTDAVGDLNVVNENTVSPNWCAQELGTNYANRSGIGLMYSKIGKMTGAPDALIIYCGLDTDYWNNSGVGPSMLLKTMELQLAHAWGPPGSPEVADLKCQTPVGNLSVAPSTQTAFVGQTQTGVATVTQYDFSVGHDVPLAGVTLIFTITSGPDAGTTFVSTSDAQGKVVFLITGAGAGTDHIVVTAVVNGVTKTASVEMVWQSKITAVDDTGTTVIGANGGTSVANVLVNDSLNGPAPVDASLVTITQVSTTNPKVTLQGTAVVVAAGTAAGNYQLVYEICEIANSQNCGQATVYVSVDPAPIVASNDSGDPTLKGANGGTSVTSVLANDTYNGNPATTANVTLSQISTTSSKVTLQGTAVVVAPATPAGTYYVTYQICDKLNPLSCKQAVVTVPVLVSPIIAKSDSGGNLNGEEGGTSVANVLANDSLNGTSPVDPSLVVLSLVGSNNPNVKLQGTSVVVSSGTKSGNYTLDYKICEKLNPTNCSTAQVTVPVLAQPIKAFDDPGMAVIGAIGGTSLSDVLWNDTLNGATVDPSKVTVSFVNSTLPGVILNNLDVIVAPGTPAGSYVLTYKVCEILNPANCSSANVTGSVLVSTLAAVDDAGGPINGYVGGTGFTNVLANDTVNGLSADPTQVTVTQVSTTNTNVKLIGTNVVVAAGTPAGDYVVVYRMCENLNPTNCKNANVTVKVVPAPILAVNDSGASVNGYVGGTSLTNVLANDKLNGAVVDATKVTTTFVSSSVPGVTLSGTNVLVAAQTPAGNQTLTYRICEKLNPTNCSTAVVTVPVTAAPIKATNDTGVAVGTVLGGTSVTDVLANDTLNGVKVIPAQVNLTAVSSTNPRVTLSGSKVVVAAGTADGTYTLTYQICEKLNPTNCSTAVATVVVSPIGACTAGTFTMTGNDALSGLGGNIKTYTINGVNVKVSAWARDKILGIWYPSYLGAYSGGLGVTDLTEGSGDNNQHACDNGGTEDNFLLFEFDRRVVPKQAAIGYVVTDSDISVWYGDAPGGVNPYIVHQSLSTATLGALTTENNNGGNAVRTASFNTGLKAANMMVVSAKIGLLETDDYVKIQKLIFGCK